MNETTTKTAYGYLRVGSIQQIISSTYLDKQRKTIKEYCRKNNIRLLDVYEDFPKSAGNLNRSALKSMLGRTVINPADYIIVTDLDRLSRNVTDFILLRQRLSELGTKIIIANKTDVASEMMIMNIFETINCFTSHMKKHPHDRDCENR